MENDLHVKQGQEKLNLVSISLQIVKEYGDVGIYVYLAGCSREYTLGWESLFILDLFILCVLVLCLHVWTCTMGMPGGHRGQRRDQNH